MRWFRPPISVAMLFLVGWQVNPGCVWESGFIRWPREEILWKMHPPKIQTYRWWKKSCTTWDVYKPCGAGFLPSTVSWVWSPPSNSGIFRLPDLLQLELLWAHPVKRDEPTNAQLMYKYDDDKWTKEAQQSNTNRQNNHPPASAICVGYERHKPLGLRRVPRLVWKAFQRACWVRTAS